MRSRPAGADPGTRARRRDSTYLPGFGSGSAGRGAAGALPPSFLLPPPPPHSATHNTRRKRKPRREARISGSQGVGGWLREGPAVPAEEGGQPEVRTCRKNQGREETWRGRWLKRGRPGLIGFQSRISLVISRANRVTVGTTERKNRKPLLTSMEDNMMMKCALQNMGETVTRSSSWEPGTVPTTTRGERD